MDFRLLDYIVKIADENNITKASEKLFISQSALNQQLLKLEQELGTQLFHRSRTNWHLTEAGEVYVSGARDALKIRQDTYNRIQDICDAKTGTLTIGLTHGRGIYMFAALYPELHARYPKLALEPVEMNVYRQQEAIIQGSIDLGFLALSPEQRTNDCYKTLTREEMVLALPASHPLAGLANPPGQPLTVIDLNLIKDIPFVMLFKESSLRQIVNKTFLKENFTPDLLFETSNTISILMMVQSSLCCGVVPYYYSLNYTEGLVYFSLPGHPAWDLTISYRKNSYLSNAARDFIQLAREYWEKQLRQPH